ncbi:MAG TPA: phage major capsid protein [Gaiellales bacterium]|nr:phage major capsid protein [Gaiellales bacterium]
MLTYLRRLVDERTSLTELSNQLTERAANEDRDLTDTERATLDGYEARCAIIDPQLVTYNEQAESQRAFALLSSKLDANREPETRAPARRDDRPASAGQLFVESAEFRGYNGRGRSGVVELTDYVPIGERAPITTADLAIPNYVLPPRQQDIVIPPMLQIVDVVNVTGGVVEWVTVTGDPQAAVVPEGTAKPEAVLTFTPTSAPLDTLAHWSQITRQALDDATYIRSVIEGKLRRGITLAVADAIQDAIVAATIPTATGTDLLGAIRTGIGTVQSAGYMPNAVVLNPADWAALDVSVMGGTLGGPTIGQTFWGLTVVPSRWQTAGVALVGDFKAGVVWFDRNVSSVFISDSHQDLFIKNILVILAETRGKAAVPEPNALCECQATP